MTIKLTISFEFDDDALKKLDSDLLRCIIFTNLPKLSLSNNDDPQDWVEIGHTEWKKIRKIVIQSIKYRLILRKLCFCIMMI